MSRTVSPSAQKPYGLVRVCQVWNIARSTVYEQSAPRPVGKRRRGPQGPCADELLIEHIRAVIKDTSSFHGEGYRKVWARLRAQGIRTSPARALRLMREYNELAPHRKGAAHGPKAHDGTIVTQRVNEMWGTDMTSVWTRHDGMVPIFVAVDHCNSQPVGLQAAKKGTRFEALEPIRQGLKDVFGGLTPDIARGLTLRHDHGSQYMSDLFQREIACFGIKSSPAFVREPQGNGVAERFIRTLKENLLWLQTFEGVEDLQRALDEFKERYNNSWILSRHGYKTPAQVRASQTNAKPRVA